MRVLLCAIALTALSMVLHLLIWWIATPRRQTRGLLTLFAAVPVATGLVVSVTYRWLPEWWPATTWEWLQIGIFYTAVVLAYIVVYSALEERSPSMTLLSLVSEQRGRGCTRRQLEAVLASVSPIEVRLAAMVRDGMITRHDDDYHLTAKGRRWVATFDAVRRILGFPPGG